MKRPKVTMEELIEREGGWLGGVRPPELSVYAIKWNPGTVRVVYPLPSFLDLAQRNTKSSRRYYRTLERMMNRKNPILRGMKFRKTTTKKHEEGAPA